MRFLIVDDDPVTHTLLLSILSKYAECDVAENGREAFDKFCEATELEQPYDLILLDVMMPEATGTECLESIRAYEVETLGLTEDERVKVIMATARDDLMTVYEAHASGCTQYLLKPIDRKKLVQSLQRLGFA